MLNYPYQWQAIDVNGKCYMESPSLSSDHLPRDLIRTIKYVSLDTSCPDLQCDIDLDRGERFIRFWTTVMTMGKSKRLFAFGWERENQQCLMYYYPNERRFLLSNNRCCTPPWSPSNPFLMLTNVTYITMPDQHCVGWRSNENTVIEAYAIEVNNQVNFRSKLSKPLY